MMAVVLVYKWYLLAGLEMVAWGVTFFLFYARYKLRSRPWFRAASVLFLLTGVIPQVLLGILNFLSSGQIDTFTLVIVLLLLYGATLGRRQVHRLDAWAKKKFSSSQS